MVPLVVTSIPERKRCDAIFLRGTTSSGWFSGLADLASGAFSRVTEKQEVEEIKPASVVERRAEIGFPVGLFAGSEYYT